MPKASGLQFTARVGEIPSDLCSVVGFALTERLSDVFLREVRLDAVSLCFFVYTFAPSKELI